MNGQAYHPWPAVVRAADTNRLRLEEKVMVAGYLFLLCFFQAEKDVIHPDFVRYFKSSPVLKQASGGKIIQIPEGFVLLGVSAYSIVDKGADELVQAEEDAVKKARASLVGTKGIRVYSVTRVEDESTVKIEDEKSSENSLSKLTSVNEEVITGKVAGSEVIGRWLSADGAERFVAVGVKLNKKGEKLPYLADFLVTLKEVLEGGKSEATRAMVEQMDQSWRSRLVSACEKSIKDENSARRAAALSAMGWGLSRWNDGEELFLKALNDPDPLVAKAGLEVFSVPEAIKAGRFKSVFNMAKERKDSAREAALSLISKITPQSMDLVDLYYDSALGDDFELTSACLKPLDGKNLNPRRKLTLARHLIKGADRSNRLAGLRMLAGLKVDERQVVLEGLLIESGSKDPATAQLATLLVESLLPMTSADSTSLGSSLGQGNVSQRLLAAQMVGTMGPEGAGLAGSLVPMIGDTDTRVVVIALAALGKIGVSGLVPVDKIREKTRSESAEVRLAAINALADLGPQSACQADLVEALGDANVIVARAASRALNRFLPAFNRENADILRKFLNSRNLVVRRYAFKTLGELGPDGAKISNDAVAGIYDQDSVVISQALRIIIANRILDKATIQKVVKLLTAQIEGGAQSTVADSSGIGVEEATQEAAPSVAFVTGNNIEGCGFLVSPRMVLASKSSCAEPGMAVGVAFPGSPVVSGRLLKGRVLKVHPEFDLALVELETNPSIRPLFLGPALDGDGKGKLICLETAGNFSVGMKVFSQNAMLNSRDIAQVVASMPSNGKAGGNPLLSMDGFVRGVKVFRDGPDEGKSRFICSKVVSDWLGNGIGTSSDSLKPLIVEELTRASITPTNLASLCLDYLTKAGPQAASAKETLVRCLKSQEMTPLRRETLMAIGSLKAEGVTLVDDLLEMTHNPMAAGNLTLDQFKSAFLNAGDNNRLSETLASLGAPAAKKISEGLLRKEPAIRFMALVAIEQMGRDGREAKALVYRSSLAINEKNLYILAQARKTNDQLDRLLKAR